MLVFWRVTWPWTPTTETLTSLNWHVAAWTGEPNTALGAACSNTHLRGHRSRAANDTQDITTDGCFAIAPPVATETQPLLSWRCMLVLTQACDSTPLHRLKVISGCIAQPFNRLLWSSGKPPRKTIPARISREQNAARREDDLTGGCAIICSRLPCLEKLLQWEDPVSLHCITCQEGNIIVRAWRASAVIKNKNKKKQEVDKFMSINAASAHSRSSAGSFAPSGSSLALFSQHWLCAFKCICH